METLFKKKHASIIYTLKSLDFMKANFLHSFFLTFLGGWLFSELKSGVQTGYVGGVGRTIGRSSLSSHFCPRHLHHIDMIFQFPDYERPHFSFTKKNNMKLPFS
jgi:hypothetical protein